MGHAGHTDDHGHAGRPAHLHHHFDTVQQQFESDKLGMWLFLVTEILLFGGLFCAYAYYRAHHPEIFIYAHKYLDKTLGGINTVILLCSSFTMAWGVRAAQLGQRKLLVVLLALTLLGGFGFLGIKFVEYKAKWEHGLLWGKRYAPHHEVQEAPHAAEPSVLTPTGGTGAPAGDAAGATETARIGENTAPAAGSAPAPAATAPGTPNGAAAPPTASGGLMQPVKQGGQWVVEHSNIPPAAHGPAGLAYIPELQQPANPAEIEDEPKNVQLFFSVYFAMTGLHGLHVIAGMVVIFIMLLLSLKGRFGPEYFTPIDLTGLYWHLVDLIWIFLFPLLYLIH